MKKHTLLVSSALALTHVAAADVSRYTFFTEVQRIDQTDLDPPYLWDESVYVGASGFVIVEIDSAHPDVFDYPNTSRFTEVRIVAGVGDYIFSSNQSIFDIRNNELTVEGIFDGFQLQFSSSDESYFDQHYTLTSFLWTSDSTYLNSTSVGAVPGSVVTFDLGNLLYLESSAGAIRAHVTGLSVTNIPEPSATSFILGLFALLVMNHQRRLTKR